MIDSKILLLKIELVIHMLYTINVTTAITTPTTTAMAIAAQRTTVAFNWRRDIESVYYIFESIIIQFRKDMLLASVCICIWSDSRILFLFSFILLATRSIDWLIWFDSSLTLRVPSMLFPHHIESFQISKRCNYCSLDDDDGESSLVIPSTWWTKEEWVVSGEESTSSVHRKTRRGLSWGIFTP